MAKVSREFVVALKLHPDPAYKLAQRAGINPNTLSKLVNGAEKLKRQDSRILAVGAVLGLSPEECFEPCTKD